MHFNEKMTSNIFCFSIVEKQEGSSAWCYIRTYLRIIKSVNNF